MNPLHDYIAHQIAERLKSRRVVVMYDPRRELAAFFDEACSGIAGEVLLRDGAFEGRKAKIGVVTLSVEERKGPAALEISSGRDRFAPRPHRRGAEGAMRLG